MSCDTVIAITAKGLTMAKFEDMAMPEADMPEEEVVDLEFDEEAPAPEGADLSKFKDDELVEELKKRGFVVEDDKMAEKEVADEEEPVEDNTDFLAE